MVWLIVGVADVAYIGALIARRADEHRDRQGTVTPDAPTRRSAPRPRPRGYTTI